MQYIPSWQRTEEEKPKEYVVNNSLLTQGQPEYQMQRAQNLTPVTPVVPDPEPVDMRDAMSGVGRQLQDNNVQKDKAWWQKALGVLEPLKYLDIPAELLAEAVFDPLEAAAPGTQFSWARGSAEREDFEGWKALFGRDQGSFKDRIDKAADAFEKRPLKMQLGMGAAQIAATGGAGFISKGASFSGSFAGRLAAQAAKAGAYAFDPAELAIKGASKATRKAFVKTGPKRNLVTGALKIPEVHMEDEIRRVIGGVAVGGGAGIKPIGMSDEAWARFQSRIQLDYSKEMKELRADFASMIPTQRGMTLFGYNSTNVNSPRFGLMGDEGAMYKVHKNDKQNMPWELSPILDRGNNFRKLFGDLFSIGNEAELGSKIQLEAYQDLAAFNLQLNMASRPGAIQGLTLGDLEDFIKSDTLTIKEGGGGWRSGTISPMGDDGASRTAAELYVESLKAWYKDNRGLLKDGSGNKVNLNKNTKVFGLVTEGQAKNYGRVIKSRFSTGGMTDRLNKYNDGPEWVGSNLVGNKSYRITHEARHMRNQRISEMIFEGWEHEDIMLMAGHQNAAQTKGYMQDIDFFIGNPTTATFDDSSVHLERVKIAGTMMKEIMSGEAREVIAKQYDEFKAVRLAAGKAGVEGRRKGKVPAGAEWDRIIQSVGEKFMDSPQIEHLIDDVKLTRIEGIVDDGELLYSKEATQLAKEALELEALGKLTTQISLGFNMVELKRTGILAAGEAGGITQQGKLLRAGFRIEKTGTTKVPDKVVFNEALYSKRAKYARDTGLDKYLGTGRKGEKISYTDSMSGETVTRDSEDMWGDWAQGLSDEAKGLQNLIDDNIKFSPEGTKTASNIQDMLAEYYDTKAFMLYEKWRSVPESQHAAFGDIGHLITRMRFTGSGVSDLTKARAGSAGWNVARREAAKAVRVYNNLDPTYTPPKVDGVVALDSDKDTGASNRWIDADHAEKDTRIKHWLSNDGVKAVFGLYKLNRHTKAERFTKALREMANTNPKIFGQGFENYGFKTTKGGKHYLNAEGNVYIEEIANKIANNKDQWLEDFNKYRDPGQYAEWKEIAKTYAPLREGLEGVKEAEDIWKVAQKDGGTYYGITPASLAKFIPVSHYQERIKSSAKLSKLLEHNNRAMAFFANKVMAPAIAMSMGGRARMSRPLTRPLAAMAGSLRRAEKDAKEVAIVIKHVAQANLGLQELPKSNVLKNIGISGNNEVFSMLRPLSVQRIRQFESLEQTKAVYTNRGGMKMPWEKIEEVTGKGANANSVINEASDLRDPGKLLTQVDVVLERILPEHWKHYFDITPDQEKALLWIKELQNQIDVTARARGVDIVGRIRDRGAEYLANYVPRVYQRGSDTVRMGETNSSALVTNNFNKHFEPRQQSDILDVLKKAMNPETQTYKKGDVETSVLLPLDQRLGLYHETMAKEGVLNETKEIIMNMHEVHDFGENLSTYVKESKYLDNLERMVNDKIAGVRELDSRRVERLRGNPDDTNLTTKFDWITGNDAVTTEMVRARSQEIFDFIDGERLRLDPKFEGKGLAIRSDAWLQDVMKRVSREDQMAMREQLEAVAPTILKPVEWLAKGLYSPTQIFRTFKAGLDVGAPFIHGYNALVRLPVLDNTVSFDSQKAWKEGFTKMFHFLKTPEFLDNYITENFADRQFMSEWITLGHSEPLAAAQSDKYMQATKRWFSRNVKGADSIKMFNRFEAGFTGFTDILRMELFKAFEPSVMKKLADGLDIPVDQIRTMKATHKEVRHAYHEMGAVINKMTGVFDQDLTMMTPMQKLMEGSLMFFAPMYRRAVFGILADLFKGGIRTREAIKQLGGVVGAGAMMGLVAEMSGNNDRAFVLNEDGEPDLTHRFGKFNVQGVQVGIGTAWWTAFRVASDLTMMHYGKEEPEVKDEHWLADNPVLELIGRRGRSQLAPGAGYLVDIISGSTFLGDPLRDKDGDMDYSKTFIHTGRAAVPFWLDGALSNGIFNAGTPISMVTEAFGLQSYPISDYDKLSAARQEAVLEWEDDELDAWRKSTDQKEVNWVSLPKVLQSKLEKEHPNIIALRTKYEENYGQIATGTSAQFREYMVLKNQQELSTQRLLAQASLAFEQGKIDGKMLSDRISKAKYAKYHANKALLDSPPFQELEQWFVTLRNNNTKKDKMFQGDLLYDRYMAEVAHDPNNTRADGTFDFDNFQQLKTQFYGRHGIAIGDEWDDYIEQRRTAWINDNPVIKDFENAKKRLQPYWRAHRDIWPRGSQKAQYAAYLYSVPDVQRDALIRHYDIFKDIEKAVTKRRYAIRDANPEIDWLLHKWYGNSPRHESVERMRIQEQKATHARKVESLATDGHPWQTPNPDWLDITIGNKIIVNKEKDKRLTGV